MTVLAAGQGWPSAAAAALLAAVTTWVALPLRGASSRGSTDSTPGPPSQPVPSRLLPAALRSGSSSSRPLTPGARRTSGRRAARGREAVIELLLAAAAELRAGKLPEPALRAAAQTLLPDEEPASWRHKWDPAQRRQPPYRSRRSRARSSPAGDVARAVLGAAASDDLALALRSVALPGADGLQQAAAGWEVASATGCELAPVLERIALGLRADEALRRRTSAALAGTRTTAWLLAALPVVTLAMGSVAGARPLDVLASPVGALCLGLGLPLTAVGLLWSRALGRRAVRGLAR